MSRNNNISRRSITSAYILTTISLTLVLFLLGSVGWLVLNSKKIIRYRKGTYYFYCGAAR